jgi:hypothetical protein
MLEENLVIFLALISQTTLSTLKTHGPRLLLVDGVVEKSEYIRKGQLTIIQQLMYVRP